MPKIVIVNKHRLDALGGSELQCDLIANELLTRGHEVIYLAPEGNQKTYDRDYSVVPCESDSKTISKIIIESDPDIVYWRYNKNFLLGTVKELDEKKCRIIFAVSHIKDLRKWVFTEGVRFKERIKNLVKHRIEIKALRYVDAITVNNYEFLDNIPGDKIKLFVPNGVYSKSEEFKWHRPYCAWVSNIKQRKRPELLINAARELKELDVDFLMAGKIHEYIYDWIKDKNKLPNNVYYLGPKSIEEVNGMLCSSEFHIHTCEPEGFPNIFLQAWAQGKPSISYGYDPSGIIKTNNIGLFSNSDWSTFLRQIEYLVNNKSEKNQMGERAREFTMNEFSIKKSVNVLEKLIYHLLD